MTTDEEREFEKRGLRIRDIIDSWEETTTSRQIEDGSHAPDGGSRGFPLPFSLLLFDNFVAVTGRVFELRTAKNTYASP